MFEADVNKWRRTMTNKVMTMGYIDRLLLILKSIKSARQAGIDTKYLELAFYEACPPKAEDKPMTVKVPYDQIDPQNYETYSEFKSAKERARAQEMETMNDR
jgi:hypothetical protein